MRSVLLLRGEDTVWLRTAVASPRKCSPRGLLRAEGRWAYGAAMKTSGKKKPLSEDLKTLDAGLATAADMIVGNAAASLRDGRWVDLVADLVEANRRTQKSL